LNSGPPRFFVVNKSLVFKYSTVPAFFTLPRFHHTSKVHGFRRLNPPKRSPRECRLRDELSTSLSWTGLFTNLLRDCHILAVTVGFLLLLVHSTTIGKEHLSLSVIMSDLALFVAAVLRDQVVGELSDDMI
jgi:hypothetical protein